MRGASFAANRILNHVGMVNGVPRISNVDTGGDIKGYTEINIMATTPFSRTKTHKGWFHGDSEISNGDKIIDKVDNSKYLVMSLKDEFADGEVVYKDATLFKVNDICTIERFGASLDEFGRVSSGVLDVIATEVWIMVNPLVIDTVEKEDRILDKDRIKVAMQSTVPIAINDRLVTSVGENFKVSTFTRAEVEGINMVYVVPDTR